MSRTSIERLLLKGHIVVKKAYCDFGRYDDFKRGLHEAAFELIDIPHVRQSGKNSADIRMVVDALDLCYTKGHVDTFAIISGDSDFSPLVSKLRENAKTVIGVGVKNSTSDLFINNCDEFIYYDDLVRASARKAPRRTLRHRPEQRADAATTRWQPEPGAVTREGVRRSARNRGSPQRGTRRQDDLGFDGQDRAQAAAPGVQRTRLRIPFVQRHAARRPETGTIQGDCGRTGRQLRGRADGVIQTR